ncbi:MAG: glycosyltransferase family 39 protein [candidate division Zixibacteria bacterium]|nr:glycosyltransferase family 39 protein [candidate division Zixibacteria bacterium]MCI0596451.1 glycosyltransferase family 39 protein [candidate division Zixibacteria bacterium]
MLRTFLLLVLVLAALLFSFFGITRSLRHDECCSVEIASTSWPGIIENLKVNAHTPPLYYFLLNLWMKLFGASEAALRSLSAVFYILSIFAVYRLGKTLYDKKTGLLAAFLFMVSPMAIWHAQDGRMYSLLPFLGILSTLYFFRLFFRSSGSKTDFALYLLVNTLGTFTHYWFFFILAAQGAAVLLLVFRSAFKKFLAATVISVLPFLGLWISVFLQQLGNSGTSWMDKPAASAFFSTLLTFYGGGKLGFLVYAAVLTLVLVEIRPNKMKLLNPSLLKAFLQQKQNLALLILVFVSLAVPLMISQVKPIYVENRYTIIAVPSLALFLGAFLNRFAGKAPLLVFSSVLLSGVLVSFVYKRIRLPAITHRSISEYIFSRANRNDILVLSTSSRPGIEYYLHRNDLVSNFTKFSFPSEMAVHPCWTWLRQWLSEKERLANEADSLVKIIDSLARDSTAKIWLVYGGFPEVEAIITNKFKHDFLSLTEKDLDPLYRQFRNDFRVYQKKSSPGPSDGKYFPHSRETSPRTENPVP